MAGIFISYRREDASGEAGRLYDRLSSHFGEKNVFMDVDTIAPGDDFAKTIEQSVTSCDASIVVIGPRWLTCTDEKGRRRLDDPQDLLRIEVVSALGKGVTVVPVLVEGAEMPRALDLPEPLAALTRHQAFPISSATFHRSVDDLIKFLDRKVVAPLVKDLPSRGNEQRPLRKTLAVALAAGALALIGTVAFWYVRPANPVRPVDVPPPTPVVTPRHDPLASSPRPASPPAAATSVPAPGDFPDLTGALKALMSPMALTALESPELGVTIVFIPGEQSDAFRVAGLPPGAVVFAVRSGPAQAAGLNALDVITAINGEKIGSLDDLRRAMKKIGPGKSRLLIRRGDKNLPLEIDCPACKVTS